MSESNTYDLTHLFVQALLRKGEWDPAQVSQEARALIQHEGGQLYWSQASGEEWMALDDAREQPYALVWTHAPLAIVQPTVSDALRAYLARYDGVLIEAADWHAVAYSVNPAVIRAQGVPLFWPLDPVDPTARAFSILDLYDVTNN